MDDHPSAAFDFPGTETTHYAAPSPYGIPYGVLYSENISNLMFAGRNISATHMGMSSTRVMGTCAMLGQAAGVAASMALRLGVDPSAVSGHIVELQNRLMDSDQWLPGRTRVLPRATSDAALQGAGVEGDLKVLLNGQERRLPDGDHLVRVADGGSVEMRWDKPVRLGRARLVVQSNLEDVKRLPCTFAQKTRTVSMPNEMPRDVAIEVLRSGEWETALEVTDNYRRLIQLPLDGNAEGVRFVFKKSWGGERSTLYSIEIGEPDYSAQPQEVSWPEPQWTGKRGLSA